jgi:hypothetical protein
MSAPPHIKNNLKRELYFIFEIHATHHPMCANLILQVTRCDACVIKGATNKDNTNHNDSAKISYILVGTKPSVQFSILLKSLLIYAVLHYCSTTPLSPEMVATWSISYTAPHCHLTKVYIFGVQGISGYT